MAKLDFIHLCDKATEDSNGKLSMLGIFRNITAKDFPAVHEEMYLVVGISGLEQNRNIKIDLLNQRQESVRTPYSDTISSDKPNVVYILRIRDVLLSTVGEYTFSVSLNDSQFGTIKFTAEQVN